MFNTCKQCLFLLVLHFLHFHILGELVGVDDGRVTLDVHQDKWGGNSSERGRGIRDYVGQIVTHGLLLGEDKRPGSSLWAIDRENNKQLEQCCSWFSLTRGLTGRRVKFGYLKHCYRQVANLHWQRMLVCEHYAFSLDTYVWKNTSSPWTLRQLRTYIHT